MGRELPSRRTIVAASVHSVMTNWAWASFQNCKWVEAETAPWAPCQRLRQGSSKSDHSLHGILWIEKASPTVLFHPIQHWAERMRKRSRWSPFAVVLLCSSTGGGLQPEQDSLCYRWRLSMGCSGERNQFPVHVASSTSLFKLGGIGLFLLPCSG